MKTKDEILSKYKQAQLRIESHIKYSLGDVLEAMQEYSDQQTEQLKKQLEEKEKEVKVLLIDLEIEKKKVLLNYESAISFEKQLSEKDKELSELKAKHEKDVKKAWQKGSESWIRGAQTAEQYYTQTHGQ